MNRHAAALALALALTGCTSGNDAPDAGACAHELPTCPSSPPSYQQTIAPIIQQKCVTCHYPGTVAAKGDFSTYPNVKANFGSMLNQTYSCLMPPANGAPLTTDERTQLLEWFVCSAPNN